MGHVAFCEKCYKIDPGGCLCDVKRTPSRDLQLAKKGALRWVPAELMTDEIRAELDEWSEIGFVMTECGCLWQMEDVDDLEQEHLQTCCCPVEEVEAEMRRRSE